jgi:uncharacterized protein involved in exopolysaccharide biosynthesis
VSWQDAPERDDYESSESSEGGIPPFLLDPMGILARRRLWMILALILGLVATGATVSTWPQRYEAQARVVINSQQIPRDFVRSTIAESSMAYLNAAVGRVLSHVNLDRIIQELGLYDRLGERAPREALVERMRGDITVEPEKSVTREGGQTSIIYRLAFESRNPQDAADVANALASLLLDATLEQRTEQARSVTRFLKQALERDESELRTQSQALTEFRREHRGELPSELEPSMRKLELLHDRRATLTSEIARLENNLDSGVGDERGISENEALLRELRRKLAGEIAANTDEHPNVVALRRRVADQEAIVRDERSGGAGSSPALRAGRNEIALMRQRLAEIDAEMDELVKRVDRIPAVTDELGSLEQKEQVLRENYLSSLRKVEEAELAESLEMAQHGAQIEILERARPPSSPKLSRWLILAAGIVASLGLAVAVGVVLEFLDPVVLDARQLEGLIDRPVLGSLPRVQPGRATS